MLVTTFSLPSLSLEVCVWLKLAGNGCYDLQGHSLYTKARAHYIICLRKQLIIGFDEDLSALTSTVVDSWAGVFLEMFVTSKGPINDMLWRPRGWKKTFQYRVYFGPRVLVWPQCWLGPCVNYKVKRASVLFAYSLGEVVKKGKTESWGWPT